MPVFNMGNGVSFDVSKAAGTFNGPSPTISTDKQFVNFGNRDTSNPNAKIQFQFKTSGLAASNKVGLKQLCFHRFSGASYEGNKTVDGAMSHGSTSLNQNLFLDISLSRLDPILDLLTNVTTGSTAVAPHAPFFVPPSLVNRNGADIAMELIDSPGGNFRVRMQNASTDRPNFLVSAGAAANFVAALVVTFPGQGKEVHKPVICVRWRWEVDAKIRYKQNGEPQVDSFRHILVQTGMDSKFTAEERKLLEDPALGAGDTLPQKFNNALFAVMGKYNLQNFSLAPRTVLKIDAPGYELEQQPATGA